MASGDDLHPIQQAYHEKHGLQWLAPGLLLATADLLSAIRVD
jgi:aerobic-type carbon monoxide dehydrogenase small subunit (CoxS/CutS family)